MVGVFIILATLLYVQPAYPQSVQQSGAITPNHIPCWVTTGVINDCGLGPTELLNDSNILLLDTAGHLDSTGSTPVLTSCGTSPAIEGNDVAGVITMGTAAPTGCVVTWSTAYTNKPHCVVSWQATPLASQSYTVTATALTLVQTGTSSNKVNYVCIGPSGG